MRPFRSLGVIYDEKQMFIFGEQTTQHVWDNLLHYSRLITVTPSEKFTVKVSRKMMCGGLLFLKFTNSEKIIKLLTCGFKSIDKFLGHCYLSEFLRGNEGVCDLRKVV